ncbi:hypothetical protein GHV72_01590 [Pseudomonas aeruginosa]|nr:hypothetical protein [Pseudomonas aeruginosa]
MPVFEVVSGGDRRSLIKRFMRKGKAQAVSELIDLHLLHCTRIENLEQQVKELENALARVADLEKQVAVAWGAFHFGGERDGKLYTHCETEAQIDAYILDMHRSSDSLTLRKSPLYAAPFAQNQPTVPEGLALIPVRETEAMHDAVMALLYKGVARTDTQKLLDAYIAAAPGNSAQHSVPDGYRLIRLEHFAAIKAQLNPEQVDAYRGRNIYDEDKVYANWNACRSALDEIKDVFQQIDWDAENELAELLAAATGKEGA